MNNRKEEMRQFFDIDDKVPYIFQFVRREFLKMIETSRRGKSILPINIVHTITLHPFRNKEIKSP